jgi:hypothetical protein
MTEPPGSPPGPAPPADETIDVADVSVGNLMSTIMKDLSTLVRQETELAKAELRNEARKAGKGAAMLGGAGYMVLLFLSMALWWGLVNVMDAGWAALIVAVLWAVIGAALYSAGRHEVRRINPKPERTVDTLQQVPGALKGERS